MQPAAGTQAVTRSTFWQISPVGKAIFYYLAAVAIALFVTGLYRRAARYRSGKDDPVERFDGLWYRLRGSFLVLASSLPIFDRDRFAGTMHLLVVWGFLVLFLGTVVLAIDMDVWTTILGRPSFFVGDFYLAYSFVLDVLGALFLVGLGMALLRRSLIRPPRLEAGRGDLAEDAFVLILVCLGIGGFLLEGVRLLARGIPPAGSVSVLGTTVAIGLQGLGVTPPIATAMYRPLWWTHALLALGFVAWFPYSKPLHAITGFGADLTRDPDAGARLPGIPADAGPADIGVGSFEDFTWRQLLEHDACTNCGRCSAVCPATAAGRPLDPRSVIMDLRSEGWDDRETTGSVDVVGSSSEAVVERASMESCTSCLACVDACPVGIEHVTQFTRLNRRLVESGQVTESLRTVMRDLTTRGNAFGEPARNRGTWVESTDGTVVDAREEPVEYLWYVGDYPSYDPRNRRVAIAFATLLDAADVSYGILYEDEQNDGNDVRRIGEEGLFEMLADANVEAFESADFETLVTTDPHAYNTLRNEYDQVGWDRGTDVTHHTTVLRDLVLDGRLSLTGTELDRTVTYHDPCHLGRYNDVYDAPREVLEATGASVAEMPRNRDAAFCCGGGGGGLWLDPEESDKPAEIRLREAVEDTDAGRDLDQFVVACPGCVTMFEDGVTTAEFAEDLAVVDVAEVLLDALDSTPGTSTG